MQNKIKHQTIISLKVYFYCCLVIYQSLFPGTARVRSFFLSPLSLFFQSVFN